jgi:beta-glucosidase
MKRRTLLKAGLLGIPLYTLNPLGLLANPKNTKITFSKADFGSNFLWGVATASYQIEGAWNTDGKGVSIWDTFAQNAKNIADKSNGNIACDFYHTYKEDIALVKSLNMDVFRFSISWTRILPNGIGEINEKGIAFYNDVIHTCLEAGLQPWITCYHWDLPQTLEDKGGWANREVINWFTEYVEVISKAFGDKVKHWMVFNEPMAFVGAGYMAGMHAPGHKSLAKFLKAIHYANLAMAAGGRTLRKNVRNSVIGSTWSCTAVEPKTSAKKHQLAAKKADAMFNRVFIEPSLGMGYPFEDLPLLVGMKKHILPDDEKQLIFDFDFIGLQNYFRTVARFSLWPPLLWVNVLEGKKLVDNPEDLTEMGWEVYPEGIYSVLKQFAQYNKPIIVTENGVAYEDKLENGEVHDQKRIQFFEDYLGQILKAKNEGVPINGYFVWTFMDNFEWAEGFHPRFGLVYTEYETQKRFIKDSGYWFQSLLAE